MTHPTDALAPSKFDYLLNAFEAASQSDKPAEHGYGDKRRKLYAYVRDLERCTSPVQADAREAFEAATRETIPPMGQAGIAQWWFSKGLQAGRASRAQEVPAPVLPQSDIDAMQKIQAEYDSLVERWREARPYSQEVANLHATFKAFDSRLGKLIEGGLFKRLLAALSTSPPLPAAPEQQEKP